MRSDLLAQADLAASSHLPRSSQTPRGRFAQKEGVLSNVHEAVYRGDKCTSATQSVEHARILAVGAQDRVEWRV